jgi:serine/threonine protein kinase
MCNPDALDFLERLLVFDHEKRILPKEAMQHPWMGPVSDMWERVESGENTYSEGSPEYETVRVLLSSRT